MSNHEHGKHGKYCEHRKVKYCKLCDITFCEHCGYEWGRVEIPYAPPTLPLPWAPPAIPWGEWPYRWATTTNDHTERGSSASHVVYESGGNDTVELKTTEQIVEDSLGAVDYAQPPDQTGSDTTRS